MDGSDTRSVTILMAKKNSQRLIGTAVSRNPDDTFAVIEDVKNRKQWIYREGERSGEILIKQILPGRIIVISPSGEEVLKLRRSQMTKVGPILRPPGKPPRTAIPNPAYKNGPRSRHYLINSEEISAALADPEKLKDIVVLRPVKLISRQKGVRLSSFSPESVFPAMGLRKRDLLLRINDQAVTTAEEAVTMLQAMFDEGDAELKVRRRARTYRIHLQDLKVR